MAKNALTIFDGKQIALPSHIADMFGDEKNILDRVSVPSLSYSGKAWTIHKDGEKTKITKKDDDGDDIPVQTMRVVILDFAQRRGRAYYEGAYDPDKPGAPLCWSDDGVKPHESVKAPQCGTCAKCPMAVKGSKTTENNKAVTACSQHRMIAVVPAGRLDFTPLRLKLAITSDWDKQSPELEKQGWFAFNNYTDFLRTRGVPHTAAIVTKMKFDPNTDYPKVMFSPDRVLEADEAAIVKPVIKSDAVQNLLGGTWTPAGSDGKQIASGDDDEDEKPKAKAKKSAPVEDDDDEPKPKAKKSAPVEDDDEDEKPKPKSKKAMTVEVDDDDEAVIPKDPPKKAKKTVMDDDDDEPAPKPKAKKKPVEDDDDVEIIPPKKGKKAAASEDDDEEPAPKKGKATKGSDLPEDVNKLLSDWDDD